MLIPKISPRGSTRFHSATLVDADHPDRAEVEAYIAAVYAERYGASLTAFLPRLLAFRSQDGELQAAVGLRRGQERPLFVEQYLDVPADAAIAARQGCPVRREEMVEVGSFAACSAGDAREVIVQLTGLLHHAGVRWVLFAATRQLRNAFDRLRLQTVELAEARPERLQGDAAQWGSYYDSQPKVLFGDIAAGYQFLQRAASPPADAAPAILAVARGGGCR
jgi:hypothetical protein